MKKAILSGLIAFGAVAVFFLFYLISTKPQYAGAYSVEEYSEYILEERFQTDRQYGEISGVSSAAKAGKMAISDRFENAEGDLWEWMGCDIQYDQESDTYYIRTYHLSPRVAGGAYDVIIRSDGTVLAIWGED